MTADQMRIHSSSILDGCRERCVLEKSVFNGVNLLERVILSSKSESS